MALEKACNGASIVNEVDNALDETEEKLNTAAGKGLITEDQHDETIGQINSVREMNNKLKCMVASIPESGTASPEEIIED